MQSLSVMMLILPLFITSVWGRPRNCASKAEEVARKQLLQKDYEMRESFGIRTDDRRTTPPTRCTDIMREKKFIPLEKRKVNGVNRERFMDADCNIYEWDYRHGAFEKYSYTRGGLRHEGEISPVYGVENTDKIDSSRDNQDMATGYQGYTMRDLCKEHGKGELSSRIVQRRGLGLSCL